MVDRRHLIEAGLAGGGALLATSLAPASARGAAMQVPSLSTLAKQRGILFGTAIGPLVATSQSYREVVVADAGLVVPEYEMKWRFIEKTQGVYDFSAVDRRLAFAQQNGMAFRGHTLVWHQSLPDWLPNAINPGNGRQLLTRHINAVAGRYKGKLHSWDVVNEAIDISPAGVGGLRNTTWLQNVGPDYIQIAFEAAAAADPGAMLVYNDYGLIYASGGGDMKRAATLRMLERLVSRGVPVHALGLQGHIEAPIRNFDPNVLSRFCNDVAALGLKIMITEIDVSDQYAPADIAVRDALVAEAYQAILGCVLAVPATVAAVTWGLSDIHSWLATYRPRKDGLQVRPLLYTDGMQKKPAWEAVASALRG
ncbi:endo-1,4-beta-xylanase [Geminicoccus roseus]|uniref:endo-1,4-beta-xylanase n=1 Tax=Geminicoccus roseus TaxID=404900 RepID=UPI0003F52145|nr:endo-1,4-beta-xylanase [Geminicoccus roseus]